MYDDDGNWVDDRIVITATNFKEASAFSGFSIDEVRRFFEEGAAKNRHIILPRVGEFTDVLGFGRLF